MRYRSDDPALPAFARQPQPTQYPSMSGLSDQWFGNAAVQPRNQLDVDGRERAYGVLAGDSPYNSPRAETARKITGHGGEMSLADMFAPTAVGWGLEDAVKNRSVVQGLAAGLSAPVPLTKLAMFAGPLARTADLAALRAAQEMAAKGAKAGSIWDKTGWFKAVDGKWKFEIPDQPAAYTRRGLYEDLQLGDVLDHPKLYEAYPDLRHETLTLKKELPSGAHGDFTPGAGITLRTGHSLAGERGTLLHEIQHAVQEMEDFARGGNAQTFADPLSPLFRHRRPTESPGAATARLAGEVEARNVVDRSTMSPEAIRPGGTGYTRFPWATEDIPPRNQIVDFARGRGVER